jgi:phosphoribosylaminoimidazole carboxylase
MMHTYFSCTLRASETSNVITGVPVATVGINNSINAVLLAVRILGVFDEGVREKVVEYARIAEKDNLDVKCVKMKELGWETYYRQMEGGEMIR